MEREWDDQGGEWDDGGPLFARARRDDPATSKAAAASLSPDALGRMHRLIVERLRAHPEGLTSRQVAMLCDSARDSFSPRMTWLRKHGYIYDSGETRPSDGLDGKQAIVWKACVPAS